MAGFGSTPALVRGAALTVLCLAMLAGCTEKDKEMTFDGVYFKTKAKAVDRKASVADFRVEVKDAGKSLDGARQAGAYEATRYCIENYGSSVIHWINGPEDAAEALVFDKGDLILRGVCQKP
ncbi:hypothetical protein [Pseudodonghicola flavimaris]|uniref:Lipoprotein n=1 Tax=Pseudodonghicola flavimaris TaxID=3050036 RepID=A0ABT7EV20_9RHOB|nr:hypothetical protein [Pseudodonghicola flavimaris]MDK3016196.1 hypothetical protein [Pseudodonghicola flavimaris]